MINRWHVCKVPLTDASHAREKAAAAAREHAGGSQMPCAQEEPRKLVLVHVTGSPAVRKTQRALSFRCTGGPLTKELEHPSMGHRACYADELESAAGLP
jgi:hypothetical protein